MFLVEMDNVYFFAFFITLATHIICHQQNHQLLQNKWVSILIALNQCNIYRAKELLDQTVNRFHFLHTDFELAVDSKEL